VSDFQKILTRYEQALLVQMEIGVSGASLIEKYGADRTLSQLFQTPGYLEEITMSFQTFSTLISRLEAFSLGFCVIRSMSATESGGCRPVNPEHVVHFFGLTGMVEGMDRNQ
jgi:hypothetical protein